MPRSMRWRPAEVSGPIELILFEHDVEKISPLMDSVSGLPSSILSSAKP